MLEKKNSHLQPECDLSSNQNLTEKRRTPDDLEVLESEMGTQPPLNDPLPHVITDFILPTYKGKPLRFVPIIIWGIILIIGLVNYVSFPDASYERNGAVRSWIYSCILLMLMPNLLYSIKTRIHKSIEEAHRVNEISPERHRSIKNWIFGPSKALIVVGIALIFGFWDFNAWGFYNSGVEQSWLYDMGGWDGINNIPESQEYYYVNTLGAILWLVVWELSWLFVAQFMYYACSFFSYLFYIIYKVPYIADAQLILKAGSNRRFLKTIMGVCGFFGIYITLKFIYQWFFDIWWSDTISTYLVFSFFLILVIGPPYMIADDLSEDIEKEVKFAEAHSINAMSDIIQETRRGKLVNGDDALQTIMYYFYLQDLKEKRKLSKDFRNNILKAMAAPILSFLINLWLHFLPPEWITAIQYVS